MENQVTKNITLQQIIASSTAKKLGILNMPNNTQYSACKLLAEKIIEPIFDKYGRIGWSSYFRCTLLNTKVGGSKTSDHQAINGSAVDLDTDIFPGVSHVTNAEIFNFIKENLDFDQLIWEFETTNEPGWVHVSYRSKGNRHQILYGLKKAGKTVYTPYTK